MSLNVETELIYNIANAPIRPFPYPHIYVPDIFPSDFYSALQQNIPDPSVMVPIEKARGLKGYDERFVLDLSEDHHLGGQHLTALPEEKKKFWQEFASWLLAGSLMNLLLTKFRPFVDQRFKGSPGVEFYNESLLVQDITKYALGPHSDSQRKVITLLFYLPQDMSQSHLGTSIYIPKDPAVRYVSGQHYRFDQFRRMAKMPFNPNSLFAFVKTDNSFHGVEPVLDPNTRRWLLLFDVYARQNQKPQAKNPTPATAQAAGGVSPSPGQVGRNEDCPCGSGKKYKHCHGQYV